ncbi:glycosyltransferase, partial [Escherichia coli]
MKLDVPAERIFVAAHAVDNLAYNRQVSEQEKAALRTTLELGAYKIVLYLGRLEEIKGVEYLIKAFASLKNIDNAVLIVAGDGSCHKG